MKWIPNQLRQKIYIYVIEHLWIHRMKNDDVRFWNIFSVNIGYNFRGDTLYFCWCLSSVLCCLHLDNWLKRIIATWCRYGCSIIAISSLHSVQTRDFNYIQLACCACVRVVCLKHIFLWQWQANRASIWTSISSISIAAYSTTRTTSHCWIKPPPTTMSTSMSSNRKLYQKRRKRKFRIILFFTYTWHDRIGSALIFLHSSTHAWTKEPRKK